MKQELFMYRCLELASLGRGRAGNGAMVGAVLVRNGAIIAEGHHAEFGASHAERSLFEAFHDSIRPTDILYINLEPCCHQGKTPPCTELLIERGIKQIVLGMRDPDPRVSGQGIAMLKKHGIRIVGPMLPEQCERLNRGFISLRTKGRPWITLKRALTRNGAISDSHRKPLKITSREQDVWSHSALRALHDAIFVGVGTIVSDDPILDTRFDQDKIISSIKEGRFPYRIILDPHLRVPLTARVVSDDHASRTIVITAASDHSSRDVLISRGVSIVDLPVQDGIFDWPALWSALTTPAGEFHGLTSILVEGGAATWKAFREGGMIDEEVTLVGKG